ncbi:DUF4376 domain-containing protein [Martelella mediterranea]|uniref:Uncharacterized protein DUF4376 n=1 Tax=Martelella mediterranea TaxID=293089 RepID=A0A4R3P2I2_9HYPH|nr:DUF4376 domain-containing protein [Martelella mediterranea]TCT41143.1 uncharacterized protein DUF4376 [Martelella mediterranea]
MPTTISPDSANALNPDLDREALGHLLSLAYPDASAGQDFKTGHLIDDSTDQRLGSAVILKWHVDADFPSPNDLHAMLDRHRDAVEAFVAARDSRMMRKAVDAARDRRIADGFLFDGVAYQSRPGDIDKISRWAASARNAMDAGATSGDYRWHGQDYDFVWIAADNGSHRLDAPTMAALGEAVLAHEQGHILAARLIKDMDPIPADYENDSYWPVPSGG